MGHPLRRAALGALRGRLRVRLHICAATRAVATISLQPSAARYRSLVIVSRTERATSAWHPPSCVRPSIYSFAAPWFVSFARHSHPRVSSRILVAAPVFPEQSFVERTRARSFLPSPFMNRGRIDSASDNRFCARGESVFREK